jgi:hypothetical protein
MTDPDSPETVSPADVDAALLPLWPDGFVESLISSMRGFIAQQRELGLRTSTIAAMLRDTISADLLSRTHLTPHDQEMFSSTLMRVIERAVDQN